MCWIRNVNRFSEKTMLIGIGAQKAGTTWLYEYLDTHPDVYMSPEKEMHIFDYRYNDPRSPFLSMEEFRGILVKRVAGIADKINKKQGRLDKEAYIRVKRMVEKLAMLDYVEFYKDYFHQRVENENIFGEITPAYSLLPKEGFQEIVSLHDRVKFIFIMRDPIDRAWSHMHMGLSGNNITISHEESLSRIFDSDITQNKFFLKSDYSKTIINLESVVPKEDILYLFYEDLFTDSSVKRICNFLNIEYQEADLSTKVRQGQYDDKIKTTDIVKNNVYADVYRFCHERFGQAIPSSWRM